MPDVPWVNFNLPPEIHARAKSKAALRGKDLYPYLIELIERGVDEDDDKDRETGRGQ